MRLIFTVSFCVLILLAVSVTTKASSGSGTFSLGYIFLDEDGNRSVDYPAFNLYEGPSISLEKYRYNFDNGMRFKANLKNIILNNRNLRAGIDKPGLFGVDFFHNQFRRIYDFDGGVFTRRHRSGVSAWVRPNRYIKLFGGGSYIGKSGTTADLFDPTAMSLQNVDYTQTDYKGGVQLNYEGRALYIEARGLKFDDNESDKRDQSRFSLLLRGSGAIPHYERFALFGGYRRFTTEYDSSKFSIESNRVWGGVTASLPENFSARYVFVFDRSGSDSALVKTDNVSHAFYLAHVWPGLAHITAGYQKDYNDDLYDEIQANSFYLAGWIKPIAELEFRGEFGSRNEEVKDGTRLLGDEERSRHKISAKYRRAGSCFVKTAVESRIRENDQLGSRTEFLKYSTEIGSTFHGYADFTAGYTFARGIYDNSEQEFEFRDHTLYGDVTFREYAGLTAGAGATYYRSKRDLDVERSMLRFSIAYRFFETHHLEVRYTVHNFDDFIFSSQFNEYYTANIVEIRLSKDLSY